MLFVNYGKNNLSRRKKNISSKKRMQKKRVGVRFFKALVICILLLGIICVVGAGIFAKKIIDNPKALMSEKDDFSAADLGVSSVEKDGRIKAGLILQSEDGDVEVDLQYSTILQAIWDREIKSVSDILFG